MASKLKTAYDILYDRAFKDARDKGLDMSEEARRARAQQMYPLETYSGSTHVFDEFDGRIANPENDWGRGTYSTTTAGDASKNYAGEGPDLTIRIEKRADQLVDYIDDDLLRQHGFHPDDFEVDPVGVAEAIAREELTGAAEKGVMYPLNVDPSEYATIKRGGGTTKVYDDPDEAYQDIADALYNTDLDLDTQQRIMENLPESIYDGELDLSEVDDVIREHAFDVYDEEGLLSPGEISSQVFKNLGYKGVIDENVPTKFGMMEGIEPDTRHVVTFPGDEGTLRSRFAAFDPDLRGQQGLLKGLGGAGIVGYGLGSSEDSEAAFGGLGAKTADKFMAGIAHKMEGEGIHPSDIWEKTGWGRGTDNKWRFEIDDSGAVFKERSGAEKLGDVLHHPELYRAYPELADIKYDSFVDDEGARGYFSGRKGDPASQSIGVNRTMSPEQKRSTGTHEAQHGIQMLEGFSRGSTPEAYSHLQLPYHNTIGEAEDIAELIKTDTAKAWKAIDLDDSLSAGQKNKAIIALRDSNPDEWRALADIMDETGKHSIDDLTAHGSNMLDKAEELKPYNNYLREAGEVEARNVQHRLDWSPKERRQIPPFASQPIPTHRQLFAGKEYGKDTTEGIRASEINRQIEQARDAQELMFPTPKQNFQKGVNTDGRYHFNQAQPSEFWNKVGAAALALPDKPMQGLFGLYGLATGGVDEGARLARMPLWESSEELSERLRNLNSNSPFVNAGAEGLKWFSRLASPLPF